MSEIECTRFVVDISIAATALLLFYRILTQKNTDITHNDNYQSKKGESRTITHRVILIITKQIHYIPASG